MLKKLIAIGLATAMTMTTLIGCSSSTNSDSETTESAKESTDNKEETKEEAKKETKDEIVTLKYYTIGTEPVDKQMVVDKINEYTREKIGAEIDLNFIDYGEYNQKSSMIINTGDDFDLMFTCSWAGDYLGNARKGAFLDLTPYLETTGKDMYEAIDPRFWEGAKIDGKVYAVPNQKEIAIMPMWVFTKKYVDKYDIPYEDIKTLEDLEPYLKTIKENEPDVTPFFIPDGFSLPIDFDFIIKPIGIEAGDNTLTVKNVYETDAMKKQLKTMRKYYEAGYVNKDVDSVRDKERFVTKSDGQPYAENIWSKHLGMQVVATQIIDAMITNDSTTGAMIGISSNTKHPEEAVKFLNLLNTDPYLRNLINYGIEGIHYEKVGENQIKLDPVKSKDYNVAYYTLGNLFITDVLDMDPQTKWNEFKKFNDNAVRSSTLGFKFNTDAVINEIAAINNVISEFESMLNSGSVNPDEYLEKFNDKLYQQGLQKVIDEVQAQLDAWVAEQ